MITHDTIITAEILAGLDKCPFCGAGLLHKTKSEATLEFGSYQRIGSRAENHRGIGCYEHENETLHARVKELEEKTERLTDALVEINEYWNRDRNDMAMHNACWNAVNTSEIALELYGKNKTKATR